MTRFILSFLFSFTCIVLYSQEVSFILQPDLSTKTAEGNDFLIIHRESQSAKDLYDQTLSTILSLQKYSNESIICKENEFIINGDLSCDKLIISCGGKSMDITGSDGSLYSLLTDMGHTLVEPLPSLVPLYADEPYLNKWNGIRCDATVSSYINGEYVSSETGELQLTDNGISGICVFNLSNAIVKALKENKYASIQINFMNMTEEETIEYFNNHFNDLTVYEILLKYFDKKLIKIFIDKSGVNQDAYYKSLTTKEISKLVGYLTKFNINITGAGDFYKSQVTQGGISLNDINLDTLESNIIKDLYLIGEVLDVDGKCGGYNLGFAWMSAIKVSDNIC